MNLIKADLFYMKKNKVFWILLAIIAAIPFAACIRMKNLFGNTAISPKALSGKASIGLLRFLE